MTDMLFFDCDCISAFLWVKEEALLPQLYPGKIMIPRPTYEELSYPTTPHLKQRVDQMVANNEATIIDIDIGTEEFKLFFQLTTLNCNNKLN